MGASLLLPLLLASSAFAQTTHDADVWINGRLGVNTTTPAAPFEVKAGSTTQTVFSVFAQQGPSDPFAYLQVQSSGAVGVGVSSPTAHLDVVGAADAGLIGVQLRGGNLYPDTSRTQLALGENGSTNYRHSIKTSHSSTTNNNAIDFFLWASGSASSLGALDVLRLVTTSTGARVHVMPVGEPDVELEVSNGSTTGGGTVHRAAEATHSSRFLKSDITYLTALEEAKALEDVLALRPAVFRYKALRKGKLERDSKQPLRRGLIFEDAPQSIRGPGRSLMYNERVTNAELAVKELLRRLEGLESQAKGLGGGR